MRNQAQGRRCGLPLIGRRIEMSVVVHVALTLFARMGSIIKTPGMRSKGQSNQAGLSLVMVCTSLLMQLLTINYALSRLGGRTPS